MKRSIKVSTKPDKCPKCGGKVVEILYGAPTYEAFEASERGEIVLGGCCISVDEEGNLQNPDWQCIKCKTQFKQE
jgi:hypothetical protein